jgi:hypothetical protein
VTLYRVRVKQTFSFTVDVEADSKAEAREKARDGSRWQDWDEAGTWAYESAPTPTRDPVEVAP